MALRSVPGAQSPALTGSRAPSQAAARSAAVARVAAGAPAAPPGPAAPAGPKMHPKYAAAAGDAGGSDLPAAAPEDPRVESARNFLGLFLKAARAAQLYPRQSRVRTEMQEAFTTALVEHLSTHGETVLDVHQLEIRSFGGEVYGEPNRQKSLAFRLFVNGVRGVTFQPGLAADEAEGVVDVLTVAFRADASGEEIQTSVWERCFSHVKFEIQEEAFTQGESEEFEGFMQTSEPDHTSAAAARESEDPLWESLAMLPRFEEDDAAAVQFTPAETAHLAALVRAESERDLFSEVSEFLLEALQAGGDTVRAPLEELFEHLLAAGDVLRAARMLSTLRRIGAAAGKSPASAVLTDVIERIGRSKIVPALAPLASSLTPADREGFTMLLTAIGEPAIAPLCDMLTTEAREIAIQALMALAPRHPAALSPILADPRPEVVRAIVPLVAAHVGPRICEVFRPLARHADAGVRREVLRIVAPVQSPAATDILLVYLDDAVYELRALALDALGASRDPRAVPQLLARIESASASTSAFELRELYRAVGRIGSSAATAALGQTLDSKSLLRRAQNDERRALAATALGHAANPGARALLMRHAEDKSGPVRSAVQQAIREFDRRAAGGAPAPRPPRP